MMDIHQPYLFHDAVQWIFFLIFLDLTLRVLYFCRFLYFISYMMISSLYFGGWIFQNQAQSPDAWEGSTSSLWSEPGNTEEVINPLCSRKLVGFGQNADVGSGFRGAPLPHCVVSGADDPQSLVVTTWVKANIQQWASKDVQCEDFYILGRLWCQTTNKVLVALTQLYPTHIKIAWGRFVLQSKPNGKH